MIEEEYFSEIQKHKKIVEDFLGIFAKELLLRGIRHDESKFSEEESTIYRLVIPKLKLLEYDSEEYFETIKELGTALSHHYKENSHHPEHFSNGIEGMNLLDIIEMFFDHLSASKRANTNPHEDLEINRKRFSYDRQLTSIFSNTIDLFYSSKGEVHVTDR